MGFGDLLVANKLPDGSFAVTTAPESLQDSNALGQQESALGGLACAADGPGLAAGIYGVKRVSAEAILGLEGVYWYDKATGNASSLEVLGQPGSFDAYRLLIEGPAKRAAADNEWFKMFADVASLGDNGEGESEEKWVNEDGREAVFDGGRNGTVMTDPRYVATYNYTVPRDKDGLSSPGDYVDFAERTAGHTVWDVLPWIALGNTRDDPTSITDRIGMLVK